MDTITFKSLVKTGAIAGVALVRPAAGAPREIHVEGTALPPGLIPVLERDDGGGCRHWTSLAAAHAFARRHGFRGAIRIEEPCAS